MQTLSASSDVVHSYLCRMHLKTPQQVSNSTDSAEACVFYALPCVVAATSVCRVTAKLTEVSFPSRVTEETFVLPIDLTILSVLLFYFLVSQ